MARQLLLLLLGGLLLLGCSRRAATIVPPDSGGDEAPAGQPDKAQAKSCRPEQRLLATYADPRGNFSLATFGTQVSQVAIANAASSESAASLDQKAVAGMVATRLTSSPASTPSSELATVFKRLAGDLQAAGLGNLAVRASGALGHCYDGSPQLKGAVWDLSAKSSLDVAQVRDRLLAAALLRPLAALSSTPPLGVAAQKLVVRLSLVQRASGQLGFAAAVLRGEDDEDLASDLSIIADDAANGSGLAAAGAKTELTCDEGQISGVPQADIIWVVDESVSMDDNRQNIVDNANLFFKKARAANLDFRMGVTGVHRPDGYAKMGKFCSRDGPQADDGGEDRFLGPAEEDTFSACVKNPPYFEQSFEYGLTNAYWAVKRHLPRAASPNRIRPGAKLAMIIATDEVAQELKLESSFEGQPGFLDLPDWHTCQLSDAKQAKLQEFITPLLKLFSGASDPEAATSVHLIGGMCAPLCTELVPEVAHGYLQLAEQLGGQTGDICQTNLGPTLQVIVDSIAASASPRVLHNMPISASLEVELNGLPVSRSRQQGFLYDALANALTFVNTKVQKGDRVVASYRRFSR